MATLNQAGTTVNKGAAEQYGQNGRTSAAFDSTLITPAGAGSGVKTASKPGTYANPANAGTGGTGTGSAGADLLNSVVIQDSTDPLVIGQVANNIGANTPDNFLNSTVAAVPASSVGPGSAAYGVATVNAAQAASAGKSLAPEHE